MCDAAIDRWDRIDVLVNNAGILRDRTFAKMDLDDFGLVLEVHLMGSVNCTKAVWDTMRARNHGRIVLAGLDASLVSPAVVVLAGDDAPTRTIPLAGAGSFEVAHVTMTPGVFLSEGADVADALPLDWTR